MTVKKYMPQIDVCYQHFGRNCLQFVAMKKCANSLLGIYYDAMSIATFSNCQLTNYWLSFR